VRQWKQDKPGEEVGWIMLSRPKITGELLSQIRQVMSENPDWGRKRISIHLCELWDWRMPCGQVKDISCRDMLRTLDKAGIIELPAPQRTFGQAPRKKAAHQTHDTTVISSRLNELQPLGIEIVGGGAALKEFKSLIDQYHYLGFDRTIGENMKYIVRSNEGTPLACFLFGSAAWSCRDRDDYIGWSREQRVARLPMVTNNMRFMVAPWVRVPCLASHALSLVARRVSADWETKYGHSILLLETFVESSRFRGSCYRAANWIRVGRTAGRGRDDRRNARALPKKDIYILPLSRRWREALLAE